MNNWCQPRADLYRPTTVYAHTTTPVASGHTWPYGYGQQYPFTPNSYPGAMVTDMSGITGWCFSGLNGYGKNERSKMKKNFYQTKKKMHLIFAKFFIRIT